MPMPNTPPNREHPFANMPWGVPIFLALIYFPLGLILGILKFADKKALEQENKARQDWAQRSYSTSASGAKGAPQPGQYGYRAATAPPAGGSQAPSYQRTTTFAGKERNAGAWGNGLIIFGLLLLGFGLGVGGLGMLAEGISDLFYWGLADSMTHWTVFNEIIPGILTLASGAGSLFGGLFLRRRSRQEKTLVKIVGQRDHVSIRELSEAAGWDFNDTLKITRSAILHGKFGTAAYIDMRTVTLVVRGAAPEPKPVIKPEDAPEQHSKDQYEELLRQLREVNAMIPGEEMTAKISQLELTTARIFERIKNDPDQRSQLNKFMDYYLPTALKLLHTYAQLDAEGMTGGNIDSTKKNIENTMDLLVTAFNNQLDKMYKSNALDVSTDIDTLKNMLNMDGLDGADDFHFDLH